MSVERVPSKGLRDCLQELIAVGLIASSVSVVWAMIEIKSVISRSKHIEDQIVHHMHTTASLADRTTATLDEIEQRKHESVPDLGFREPPPGTIKPEELGDSITPPEGE